MLIGSTRHLAFEILALQPSWEISYTPEKAAWAGLSVLVAGNNICRHIDPETGRVQDHLHIPLGAVADWIVRSWPALYAEENPRFLALDDGARSCYRRWTRLPPPSTMSLEQWHEERWSWWERHFLEAGVEGALVPDLALSRDGDDLIVSWAEIAPLSEQQPREEVQRVEWASAEDALTELVGFVAQEFRRSGHADVYPWLEQEAPLDAALRNSPERLLELFTGQSTAELRSAFDLSATESLPDALSLQNPNDPGSSVLTQILRCLPSRAAAAFSPPIRDLDSRAGAEPLPPEGMSFKSRLSQTVLGIPDPEDRGHEMARELRREMRLNGQPLPTSDLLDIAEKSGLLFLSDFTPPSDTPPDIHGLLGCRDGFLGAAGLTESKKTSASWARRFELARLLGVYLLGPRRSGALGWATSSRSSARTRRASGAFAAELLLPRSGAEEMSGGSLDDASAPDLFQRILDNYEIGARAAAFQLWNCNLISSANLRDELIEEFSASR